MTGDNDGSEEEGDERFFAQKDTFLDKSWFSGGSTST